MDATVAKNLTRADLVKLLSRQLIEDREADLAASADAVSAARDEFCRAVQDLAWAVHSDMINTMLDAVGGNRNEVVVDTDYELHDDELADPHQFIPITIRDGARHSYNFAVRLQLQVTEKLDRARQAWISAVHRASAAVLATRKVSEVSKEVRLELIQKALDSTEAGRQALGLLPEVRKEAARLLEETND